MHIHLYILTYIPQMNRYDFLGLEGIFGVMSIKTYIYTRPTFSWGRAQGSFKI